MALGEDKVAPVFGSRWATAVSNVTSGRKSHLAGFQSKCNWKGQCHWSRGYGFEALAKPILEEDVRCCRSPQCKAVCDLTDSFAKAAKDAVHLTMCRRR